MEEWGQGRIGRRWSRQLPGAAVFLVFGLWQEDVEGSAGGVHAGNQDAEFGFVHAGAAGCGAGSGTAPDVEKD